MGKIGYPHRAGLTDLFHSTIESLLVPHRHDTELRGLILCTNRVTLSRRVGPGSPTVAVPETPPFVP